jgi:hypothetical protein
MKHEKGNWRVVRFCCTSGLCCECHARGNHGDKRKRQLICDWDNVSEAYAKYVANGWRDYGVEAEPIKTMADRDTRKVERERHSIGE